MFTINGKLFSSSDSVSRYASSSRALHSSSLSIRSIIAPPPLNTAPPRSIELFRHYEDLRCTYASLNRPLARTSLLLSSASSIGHSLVEPFLPQAADSFVKAEIIRRRLLTLSLMATIFWRVRRRTSEHVAPDFLRSESNSSISVRENPSTWACLMNRNLRMASGPYWR
jgi:hypothetical protein